MFHLSPLQLRSTADKRPPPPGPNITYGSPLLIFPTFHFLPSTFSLPLSPFPFPLSASRPLAPTTARQRGSASRLTPHSSLLTPHSPDS